MFIIISKLTEKWVIFPLVLILLTGRSILANNNYVLLGKDSGVVASENFTYYYIYYSGNKIALHLETTNGDADMYISDTVMLPTYEPTSYDFHSATCGEDKIDIPEGYKNPFAVGVYGHSSHEISQYNLEIYQSYEDIEGSYLIIEQGTGNGKPGLMEEHYKKGNEKMIKTAQKFQTSTITRSLFPLFDILELIFL